MAVDEYGEMRGISAAAGCMWMTASSLPVDIAQTGQGIIPILQLCIVTITRTKYEKYKCLKLCKRGIPRLFHLLFPLVLHAFKETAQHSFIPILHDD
jgi:hypothetical protein